MKFLARFRSRGKKRSKLFRYGWKITLFVLVAGVGLALLLFYGAWAASFDMKKVGAMPERNTVFDVDGKIYSRLAGANRVRVSLAEISPFFIDALLAREDTRFYRHPGVDWLGIFRALVRDILTGSAKEGASSITQQLARNSLPLGGRTVSRKLLEAMVALRIEHEFTKQQILELYVNRIYFGAGCYGIETASQAYFGKSASKLNLSEAAVLAGLIRSPNRFSPLRNPEGAATQRDAVLDRMMEIKKISSAQAQQAKSSRINPHPKKMPMIQENYAMDAVQRDLNVVLTPANRQVGSAFKPFVYTLAFTNGLLPGASINDGPIQPGEIEGSGNWAPGNSDGTYGGIQPASYGLIHSRNTMSVRVGQFAGLDQVQKVATTLNLSDKAPHGPAIYIGSFETNLKDLTTAYTSNLPCGVWVGFDQPTTIISRGYGAALALPVWVQVMNKSATRYPAKALEPTMPMARVTVCAVSNALATTGCEMAGSAYDIVLPADKVPTQPCPVHGGEPTEFAQRIESIPKAIPKLFQSFRKFFGGK